MLLEKYYQTNDQIWFINQTLKAVKATLALVILILLATVVLFEIAGV